jgi:hypothetical protein
MPDLVRRLADAWANDPSRPRPSRTVVDQWDALVAAWSEDPSLPIFVRKASNNRGSVLTHSTGRQLVPTDNSPAQWAFALAVLGETPDLTWVREQLARDRIPVAMIQKATERVVATFRCTLGRVPSPTAAGWKVAHIDPVGLSSSMPLETTPESRLREHFVRLMSPRNMFVIPTKYAGLGELAEFCDQMRRLTAASGPSLASASASRPETGRA